MLVFASSAWAQSPPSIRKDVPPLTDETKRANTPEDNSQGKHAVTVTPPIPDKSMGGKLEFKGDNENTKRDKEGPNWAEWLIALFTGALVYVTARLVFYTKNLWGATDKLVRGADNTAEKQLRAYVGCFHIELECPNLTNPRYVRPKIEAGLVLVDFILLSIKNYGQTPAGEVRTWVNWYSTERGHRLPIDFSYPDYDSITTGDAGTLRSFRTLFPTQEAVEKIPIGDLDVFQRAHQGLTTLYVYGRINYRIYGGGQITEFCFVYEPLRPVGEQFTPIEGHHKTT